MPNTNPSVIDKETLNQVKQIASKKAHCDYALMMGASSDNAQDIALLAPQVAGLKMYLNETFTTLRMDKVDDWLPHFKNWPSNAPLCVHAEGRTTSAAILLAHLTSRPIHICHVARKEELMIIKEAKDKGMQGISCEVCPHHLLLTEEDAERMGNFGQVRPSLVSQEDREYLWANLDYIDSFATDHAPHTPEEKKSSKAPPGFPGLETMLPLLLTAVNEGKLTIDDIKKRLYDNPKRIFNLPDQPETYIEVNLDEKWTIENGSGFSKAQWTPFAGRNVVGKVLRVVLRGKLAFVDGKILVDEGFGEDVRQWSNVMTTVATMTPQSPTKAAFTSPIHKNRNRIDPRLG